MMLPGIFRYSNIPAAEAAIPDMFLNTFFKHDFIFPAQQKMYAETVPPPEETADRKRVVLHEKPGLVQHYIRQLPVMFPLVYFRRHACYFLWNDPGVTREYSRIRFTQCTKYTIHLSDDAVLDQQPRRIFNQCRLI